MSEPSSDDIDDRYSAGPTLGRVISVGPTVTVVGGGRTVITSVELWSDRVVVHSCRLAPDAGYGGRRWLEWALADDAGNRYRLIHLTSGKGELVRTETGQYQPHVADAARRLLLTVPGRATDADVVIDLARS